MKKNDSVYLNCILDYIELIEEYTETMEKDDFLSNVQIDLSILFIYSFPRIDIDNNYDDLFIVDTIKNPKIANPYSKKFFAGAVDSFGIMRDRIFGKFFDGFDDSLAVFGIEFSYEIL